MQYQFQNKNSRVINMRNIKSETMLHTFVIVWSRDPFAVKFKLDNQWNNVAPSY